SRARPNNLAASAYTKRAPLLDPQNTHTLFILPRKSAPLCDASALADSPASRKSRPKADSVITGSFGRDRRQRRERRDPGPTIRADEVGARRTYGNVDTCIFARHSGNCRAIARQLRAGHPRLSTIGAFGEIHVRFLL